MDLYSKIKANQPIKQLKQPNLTRQRHRFKGVRESEKFNLEMDQIRYDLLNTSKQINELQEALIEFYEYYRSTTEIGDVGDLDSGVLDSFMGYLNIQMVPPVDEYAIEPTELVWDGGELDVDEEYEGNINGGLED